MKQISTKISVIVPIYKVEPWLRPCVDSILAQTWTDFELILVDDGSPDRCGAICDEYAQKDSRVRVVHRENGGLSAARNSGTQVASGRYLTYIDSDDVIPEDYLELLLKAAQKTGADIAVCGNLHFQDGSLPPSGSAGRSFGEIEVLTGEAACKEVYSKHPFIQISAWGKLFSADMKDLLVFPAGKIYEDQWTVPILLYNARTVAAIPEKLYYYRVRGDSITAHRFSLKNYDNIEALDHAVSYFRSQNAVEVLRCAESHRTEVLALWTVLAKIAKLRDIPPAWRMPLRKALRIVQTQYPNKYYDLLNQVYPLRIPLARAKRHVKRLLHMERPR